MAYEPSSAGKSEGHRLRSRARIERGPDFRVAFGRAESHHDVFGPTESLRATAGTAWKDRAPEARACRQLRDERTRPRRAARRWRRGRGRRPASVPPRRKRSDISRQASARRCASRAKKVFEHLVARQKALFDLRGELTFRGHGSVLVVPRSVSSADARQWIADQHVDDPAAAVKRRHQDGAGGLFAYFADHARFLAAGCCAQSAEAPHRRVPAQRPREIGLRWQCATDRGPAIRRRRERHHAPECSSSERTTPSPQSRASSFKEVATPPRVGSRIQRMPGPAARNMASTSGNTLRVSEYRSPSISSSPRASKMVMP